MQGAGEGERGRLRGIRLVLAEDSTLVRQGIRAMLEWDGAFIAGEARNGLEAVRLAAELSPDVILLDVTMPELGGIEAARRIHASQPNVNIVMVSVHADRRMLEECIRAGALGYVSKGADQCELLAAIEAARSGKPFLSAALRDVAVEDYVRRTKNDAPASEIDVLSDREIEVLKLIADGHASAEIGRLLHISARTVDTHRQSIMKKLGLRSIAELTKCAVRCGLCILDP